MTHRQPNFATSRTTRVLGGALVLAVGMTLTIGGAGSAQAGEGGSHHALEDEAVLLNPRATQSGAAVPAPAPTVLDFNAQRDLDVRRAMVGKRFKFRNRGVLKLASAGIILPMAGLGAYTTGQMANDMSRPGWEPEGSEVVPPNAGVAMVGIMSALGFAAGGLLVWSAARDFRRYRKLERQWEVAARLSPTGKLTLTGRF